MKKTKQLNWSPVLTILLLALASFTFVIPTEKEAYSPQNMLDALNSVDILINRAQIDESMEILDLRTSSEFEIGHLPNAKNIYINSILDEDQGAYFEELQKNKKTVVLVGNETAQVLPAFKVLYQQGMENLKIGTLIQKVENNMYRLENEQLDTAPPNIQNFIDTSVKKAAVKMVKPKPVVVKPKKVIPKKKKKKMPIEGGC